MTWLKSNTPQDPHVEDSFACYGWWEIKNVLENIICICVFALISWIGNLQLKCEVITGRPTQKTDSSVSGNKNINNYAKQKQSLYRPTTGPKGSRKMSLPDFGRIGTWRWWGCQPFASALFTPQKIPLILISVKRLSWSQCQIPKTPSKIEPTIFWLIAPGLNQPRSSKQVCSNITLQKQPRRWRFILSHNAVLYCDIKYNTAEMSTNLMNVETSWYCHNKYVYYFSIIRFTLILQIIIIIIISTSDLFITCFLWVLLSTTLRN